MLQGGRALEIATSLFNISMSMSRFLLVRCQPKIGKVAKWNHKSVWMRHWITKWKVA